VIDRISGHFVVIVLGLINIALVAYALNHFASGGSTPVTRPVPPVNHHHHHHKSAPTATVKAASVRVDRDAAGSLFSADSPTDAWRATGGCTVPADLAVTNDSGADWVRMTQPAEYILAIHATGRQTGWVVGADASCIPGYYKTTDGGRRWASAAHLGKIWVRLPFGVLNPRGSIATPCGTKYPSPVVLAGVNARVAAVMCKVGVFRTTNGGRTWSPTAKLPKGHTAALALSRGGKGVLILVGSPRCSGARVIHTANAGQSWTIGRCLRVATTPMVASISTAGSGMLLGVDTAYQTTDYGSSWN
jgi:photosystem II stability/assembly factor-like uncharacterized protein